ncbi:MAG: outer membrane lipid asymmetry maintenance protein MlaD [Myxococcales bacterium]|nr:outer membrane lipid asymmetry maintenance protein MlaD [Myxococcales bacterium]
MSEYTRVEMAVGMFVLLGLCALGYLSVSIGGASLWPTDRYGISARFASVGDLSEGAVVKLAGVSVGEVDSIGIDRYAARVGMRIDRSLELPADTIASVKTEGLLGEAYVSLSPGASEDNLQDGGRITQTEPPLDLFELVEKYAFDRDDDLEGDEAAEGDGGKTSPFPDPLE